MLVDLLALIKAKRSPSKSQKVCTRKTDLAASGAKKVNSFTVLAAIDGGHMKTRGARSVRSTCQLDRPKEVPNAISSLQNVL